MKGMRSGAQSSFRETGVTKSMILSGRGGRMEAQNVILADTYSDIDDSEV